MMMLQQIELEILLSQMMMLQQIELEPQCETWESVLTQSCLASPLAAFSTKLATSGAELDRETGVFLGPKTRSTVQLWVAFALHLPQQSAPHSSSVGHAFASSNATQVVFPGQRTGAAQCVPRLQCKFGA
jgi:hypothetical protein